MSLMSRPCTLKEELNTSATWKLFKMLQSSYRLKLTSKNHKEQKSYRSVSQLYKHQQHLNTCSSFLNTVPLNTDEEQLGVHSHRWGQNTTENYNSQQALLENTIEPACKGNGFNGYNGNCIGFNGNYNGVYWYVMDSIGGMLNSIGQMPKTQ